MADRDFQQELKQEVYDKYTIKYNSQARDSLESALPKVARGSVLGVLGAGAGVGLSFLLPGVGVVIGAGVGFALAGPISQIAYSTVYSAKNLSSKHFSKIRLSIEDATTIASFEDLDNQQLNILGVKRVAEICDRRARAYANTLRNTSGTGRYTITDENGQEVEVSERKLKRLIKENEEVARNALSYIMNIAVEQSNRYRNLDAGTVKVVNSEASKQYCMFMLQVAGQTASNLVAERINLGEVNPYKGTILRALENKALIATTRGRLDTLPMHNVTNANPSFNERIQISSSNKDDLLTLYTEMYEKSVLEYHQEQRNIRIEEQGRIAENTRAQIIRLNNLIRADKKLANWLNANGLLDELLKNKQTDIALIRLAQGIASRLTAENRADIDNAILELRNANNMDGNSKVKQARTSQARQNLIMATEDALGLIHTQGEQQGLAEGQIKIDELQERNKKLQRKNKNLNETLSSERIDSLLSERKLSEQLDAYREQNVELIKQLNLVNTYLKNLKERGNVTGASLHEAVSLIQFHIDGRKLPARTQERYDRLLELDKKKSVTKGELSEYTSLINGFLTSIARKLQEANSKLAEQEQQVAKSGRRAEVQARVLDRHKRQESDLRVGLAEEQEKSKLQQEEMEVQAEALETSRITAENWQKTAESLAKQVRANSKNSQQTQQRNKEIVANLIQMVENLREALRTSQIDTQTANEQISKLEESLKKKSIRVKGLNEKIETLKKEIKIKEAENQDLQRQNANYQVTVDGLIKQLKTARQEGSSPNVQIDLLKKLIVRIKLNLDASNDDVSGLKEQVTSLKKELKKSNLLTGELNSQIETLESEVAQREKMLEDEKQQRTAFKNRVIKTINTLDNGNLEAMQTAYAGLYKKCIESGLTDAETEEVLKNLAQQIENVRTKSNKDARLEQNLGFATEEDEIIRRLTDVFGTRIDTTILQNGALSAIADKNKKIAEALTVLEQQLADAQKDAQKQSKRADKAEKTAKTQTKRAENAERERDEAVKGRDALSVELEAGTRRFESQIASLTNENESLTAQNAELEQRNQKLLHENVGATRAMFQGALKMNELEEQRDAAIKGAEEMYEQNLIVINNLLAKIDKLLAELEDKNYQIRDVSQELHKYKDRFDHPTLERQFGRAKNGLRRKCRELKESIEHCSGNVEIQPTLQLAKKVLLTIDIEETYDVKDENGWRVRYYTDEDIQSLIQTYKELSDEVSRLTEKINRYSITLL